MGAGLSETGAGPASPPGGPGALRPLLTCPVLPGCRTKCTESSLSAFPLVFWMQTNSPYILILLNHTYLFIKTDSRGPVELTQVTLSSVTGVSWPGERECLWVTTVCVCLSVFSRFSRIRLFATLQTVARQTPLSLGFSRREC